MKIKLKTQESNFLRIHAHTLTLENGDMWFYMPYWWHNEGGDVFKRMSFEDMPEDLKNYILNERNINNFV